MTPNSPKQLEVTQRKLALMEEQYDRTIRRPFANERLRETTLHSLKRTINKFKEEIARYHAGVPMRTPPKVLQNDQQLQTTRRKLAELERMYEKSAAKPASDASVDKQSRLSLMRMINQLKEEIARYETSRVAAET